VDVLHPIFGKADADHIRWTDDVIIVNGDVDTMKDWIINNVGKYDIVHVHAILEYIPMIRHLFPNIKIIFTGHGTNVRGRWQHHKMLKDVDYITVVSEDLLEGSPPGTEFIPNVADPAIWKRKNDAIEKLAVYKYFGRTIYDEKKIETEAKKYARDNDLTLHKQDRSRSHISNKVYPRYLEKYGVFIDYKFLNPSIYKTTCTPLSYTAIQFLTLGGNKVVHCTGEYTELPDVYNYDDVMELWDWIYNEVMT